MDNISGNANNWFKDESVKEDKVVVEEIIERIPYIPSDLTPLREFIKETQMKYSVTPKKELGDALVYLESANKILNKI